MSLQATHRRSHVIGRRNLTIHNDRAVMFAANMFALLWARCRELLQIMSHLALCTVSPRSPTP
eukprot:3122809-Rhodomonas_salina.3